MVQAINNCRVVAVVRYAAGMMEWTKINIRATDCG